MGQGAAQVCGITPWQVWVSSWTIDCFHHTNVTKTYFSKVCFNFSESVGPLLEIHHHHGDIEGRDTGKTVSGGWKPSAQGQPCAKQ
jgi:hypothetical protein